MSAFHVANSQVVFVYDRNKKVRERVFEYEKLLSNFFKTPFNIPFVGDEEDGNFPRFQAVSLNGHSRIQVSQLKLDFFTTYTSNFGNEVEKVKNYIDERINLLKTLSKPEKNQFIGFIFELAFPMDKNKINDFLIKNTGTSVLKSDTVDFVLLYSNPYKDKFYLNIKCSKYSLQKYQFDPIKNNIATKQEVEETGIAISVDLNSKLFFIQKKEYLESLVDETKNCIINIIASNQLTNYLKGDIK